MVKILSTALLLAVLTVCAAQLGAQQSGPQRVPVTVVMVDRLVHPDVPFTIQRRPDLKAQDVIVLRSDATPDQLSDAVRGLLTARQVGGDSAAAPATMRIRPNTPASTGGNRAAVSRPSLPWVPRVLADLRRAEYRDVPGIGHVRAVEIWLPRQGRPARRL